ncbi:MAG: hypothetical protein A2504_10295 [Bdellovibrionales bacterium RIFOXYD12_FULL_39_22]|nr:MAG: hypothetical protein A2385_16910 [Bdellovibrionales bacterium RIFOXYB1_FULL_39_21]OFZ44131.1 MAG: hypothetical protein A2485_14330 [Bdellovibrionales bacterium RIFOXYC12_FULL_39_17]OFZ48635.1 MAG: hypothetical protein A2404_08115 [Bdellovibrionales bacterium RIFOXYC1_FULL_39_130]OFZ70808.1 MAG: hypothetical protein A2451_06500 [Bdellovibrionales bacterium RIFOXYC2_FULL_39_8]OFZ76749.1 MAG: hypothetical protein A2560_10405 [Bdellovibrionales bacterium RIFOXYD1_FULL_39_84]OFZ95052.1 MAG:
MALLSKKFERDKFSIYWKVDVEQDGMRLDQFILSHFSTLSREEIKRKIASREVIIINRPTSTKASSKVHSNDEILLAITKTIHEDEYWNNELISLEEAPEVIFEDNELIIISKPPFMSTHPAGRHLFYCATVFFETVPGKTIHSIHRLDRETSGILLLGKDPQTSAALATQFESSLVKKCYFFIAKGPLQTITPNFTANERLDSPYDKDQRIIVEAYPENSNRGKTAQTFFKIIYQEKNYALGLAFPQTGRQHQIRVHAAIHQLPLLGDKLYCGGYELFQRFKDRLASPEDHALMEIPRHALHAIAIKINYKNEERIFITKIPSDLHQWIARNLSIDSSILEGELIQEINAYFSLADKKHP